MARAELSAIRGMAQSAASASNGLFRAHWQDIIARVDAVLEVGGE